jgi:HAD superfamily hydrolase (TIGR01509 family)
VAKLGGVRPGLVIFDCDGVLVDSEPIAVRIDMAMLAEELGHPPPDGWFERAERRLRKAFETELRPVAGIQEALGQIDAPVCVASSSEPANLRFKLELTGLYDRFEGRLFSASEVANGKPDPDLFLHAAARMGVEPACCVVVEDSRHGVAAGRAAGMGVLAYAGGGMTPATVLGGPRTTVFYDMRQLPGLIHARASDAA